LEYHFTSFVTSATKFSWYKTTAVL